MASPTLRDVANLAGVSTGTTSQALNNRTNVSQETREWVLNAATTLGYEHRGRSANTGEAQVSVVGMLTKHDYGLEMVVNPFYYSIQVGVESECRLSLIGWTGLARVVRSKFLALREEDFILAATLDGVPRGRMIFKHMIPSFLSHIIASVTLAIPGMILGETALELYTNPRHPYTEALLSAVPIADPNRTNKRRRIHLQGEIADPSNPPSGCYFHPRYMHAVVRCKVEAPALRDMGGSHFVACHRAEEVDLQGVIHKA